MFVEQSVRAISVRCLPQNLPEIITVDVSALKIGESIHIRDIKLPAGVTIEDNADLTVFIVAEPSVAAEPAAAGDAPGGGGLVLPHDLQRPAGARRRRRGPAARRARARGHAHAVARCSARPRTEPRRVRQA
mgnify:CR=1 FL=1